MYFEQNYTKQETNCSDDLKNLERQSIWFSYRRLKLLQSLATAAPCFFILLIKALAVCRKLSLSVVHRAILRSSEERVEQKILDGILLERYGILTISKGKASLLSKSFRSNLRSMILISRSKNDALSIPSFSFFNSISSGQIFK